MALLRLADGATSIVDEDTLSFLSIWHWRIGTNGYVFRETNRVAGRQNVRLHRVVVGLVHGDPLEVDHINRNKLDNRRVNLRIVTAAENNQNQPPRTGRGMTSRFRGVRRLPSGRWQACVGLNYTQHYLGSFDTELEAAQAASAFRAEHMPFSLDARLSVVCS